MIAAPLMLAAQDGNIVVRKDARTSNPTLKVQSWKGDPVIMRLVKEDLIFSDWFTVTDKPKADYSLSGEAVPGRQPLPHPSPVPPSVLAP